MKVLYRISDAGYAKVKPGYINNPTCLANAVAVFGAGAFEVIADGVSETTHAMVLEHVPAEQVRRVEVGHGAGTFNLALDRALEFADDEVVYFLENDYLHTDDAASVLLEGIGLGMDFVALYDHPDKYLDPADGGNPRCEGGAEDTRVYLTDSSHWKITNSTTMTFAARVGALRAAEPTLRRFTDGTHPHDFEMFTALGEAGHRLVTPIPGRATHGETALLSPLVDWSEIGMSRSRRVVRRLVPDRALDLLRRVRQR